MQSSIYNKEGRRNNFETIPHKREYVDSRLGDMGF